jgi:hypothetical protein
MSADVIPFRVVHGRGCYVDRMTPTSSDAAKIVRLFTAMTPEDRATLIEAAEILARPIRRDDATC